MKNDEAVEWVIDFKNPEKQVMFYIPDPVKKEGALDFIQQIREERNNSSLNKELDPNIDDLMDLVDQFLDLIKKIKPQKKDYPDREN